MIGRVMSLFMFMFIFMGLAPLSGPAAGWLLRWMSLPDLYTATGLALLAIVAAGWVGGSIPRIGREQEQAAQEQSA